MKKNAKVEVVSTKKSWVKVKYKKGYGWVAGKHVKKISIPITGDMSTVPDSDGETIHENLFMD